jgi:hypothetical protein
LDTVSLSCLIPPCRIYQNSRFIDNRIAVYDITNVTTPQNMASDNQENSLKFRLPRDTPQILNSLRIPQNSWATLGMISSDLRALREPRDSETVQGLGGISVQPGLRGFFPDDSGIIPRSRQPKREGSAGHANPPLSQRGPELSAALPIYKHLV